jgi:hypothetical protein
MSTANALTGARSSGSTQQPGAPSRTTSGIGTGAEQPGRRTASKRREPASPSRRGPAAGRASTGVTRTSRAGESPVRRDVRRSQRQPTGPIGPSGRPAREDGLLQTNQVDRQRAPRAHKGRPATEGHGGDERARKRDTAAPASDEIGGAPEHSVEDIGAPQPPADDTGRRARREP